MTEKAAENLSGLDIVTNPALEEKFFFVVVFLMHGIRVCLQQTHQSKGMTEDSDWS
jgi:hypothetical protein